jgi:hypothetical protein
MIAEHIPHRLKRFNMCVQRRNQEFHERTDYSLSALSTGHLGYRPRDTYTEVRVQYQAFDSTSTARLLSPPSNPRASYLCHCSPLTRRERVIIPRSICSVGSAILYRLSARHISSSHHTATNQGCRIMLQLAPALRPCGTSDHHSRKE